MAVERFDFSRPTGELIEVVRRIQREFGVACLFNVIEFYVAQTAEVLNLIRHLRDQGIAVVLISHRMPDVFDVADRVIVMRRGRKVADKKIALSSPEEVTGLITGAIEQVA